MCISLGYVIWKVGLTYVKHRATDEVQRMDGLKEVINFYIPSDTVLLWGPITKHLMRFVAGVSPSEDVLRSTTL
jgi:hypothetical protein